VKLKLKSLQFIFKILVALAAIAIPISDLYRNVPENEALLAGIISALFISFLVNFPFHLLGHEITLVQVIALGTGLIYGGSIAIWGMTAGFLLGAILARIIQTEPLPHNTLKNLSWGEIIYQLGLQTIPLALTFYAFRWTDGFSQNPGFLNIQIFVLIPIVFAFFHTIFFGVSIRLSNNYTSVKLREDTVSLMLVECLPLPFVLIAVVAYPAIGFGSLAALGGIPAILAILMHGMSSTRATLERRLQDLSTINHISTTLRSTLELEPVLETIHVQVTQLLGVESFYVALYDDDSKQIWYPISVKNNERQKWRSRPIANRLTDRVVLESKPIILPRHARESLPAIGLSYGEEALNAWLGVPLITSQRTIGCLAVLSASAESEFTTEDQDLLTILSGQVSVAIENALLLEQAQTRAVQLENLNQISTLITASLNLKEVLAKVCKSVTQVGGGQQSAIYLLSPHSGEINLAHSQALSVEFVQNSLSFSAANSVRARCLRTGQPLIIPDVHQVDLDEKYLAELDEANIRAFGDFPLATPDGHIGFLSVYFDSPHRFPSEQVELLQTFASQAALAVANARLHAQTDHALSRRVHQLSILEAVGRELSAATSSERLFQMILDYALEFTNSTWGSVMLHDKTDGTVNVRLSKGYALSITHYSTKVGIVGRVLRTKTAANIPDVNEDSDYMDLSGGRARSQLVVPLLHEAEVMGVISIESPQVNAFDNNDQAFVSQLSNQAAVALVNINLYEETQRRLREQSSLYLVSSKLVASLSLENVGQTIGQAIAAVMDASLTGIYLWDEIQDAYALHTHSATSYLQNHSPLPDLISGGLLRINHPQLQTTGTLRVYQSKDQMVKLLNLCPECQALILPLTMGGEHFGIVVLHSPKERKYSEEEIRLTRTVAAQGSIAIQNALLFKDVTQGRDRLEAVLNSVEEGIMMINADGLVTLANERIGEFIQTPNRSLINTRLLNLPDSALQTLGFSNVQATELVKLLDQGMIPAGIKTIVHRKEGGPEKVLECTTAPVWGQEDRAMGVIIVVRNITEEHEINQARELLTQTVVHDLKSPMTAITSALALIEETTSDETMDRDILEQSFSIADRSAQRILALVEALLDIAKMESGQMILELGKISSGELLEQVCKDFLPQARSIGVVLQTHLAPNLPEIRGDTGKIIRLLANLLDNALKFTPTGGQVVLNAEQTKDQMLKIQIADNGPGIPLEHREKIFDRFAQVPGQKGRQRGSGLGLTFCRLVVEAHGGKIWVDSNPLGGSMFTFTLPIRGPTSTELSSLSSKI
jgi:two-component system, NtrC family, sensor histidine kinase KinB